MRVSGRPTPLAAYSIMVHGVRVALVNECVELALYAACIESLYVLLLYNRNIR